MTSLYVSHFSFLSSSDETPLGDEIDSMISTLRDELAKLEAKRAEIRASDFRRALRHVGPEEKKHQNSSNVGNSNGSKKKKGGKGKKKQAAANREAEEAEKAIVPPASGCEWCSEVGSKSWHRPMCHCV